MGKGSHGSVQRAVGREVISLCSLSRCSRSESTWSTYTQCSSSKSIYYFPATRAKLQRRTILLLAALGWPTCTHLARVCASYPKKHVRIWCPSESGAWSKSPLSVQSRMASQLESSQHVVLPWNDSKFHHAYSFAFFTSCGVQACTSLSSG